VPSADRRGSKHPANPNECISIKDRRKITKCQEGPYKKKKTDRKGLRFRKKRVPGLLSSGASAKESVSSTTHERSHGCEDETGGSSGLGELQLEGKEGRSELLREAPAGLNLERGWGGKEGYL